MSNRRKFNRKFLGTVFLLHLDNDTKDSVSGKDVRTESVQGKSSKWYELTTTKAKFGKCGFTYIYSPSYDISHLNLKNAFTIDFWLTIETQPSSDWSSIFSTSQTDSGLIFRYFGPKYGYILTIGNLWDNDNGGWVKSTLSDTSPVHIAITRDVNVYKLYVDGILKSSVTSSRDIKTDQLTFSNLGWPGENNQGSNTTRMYIDEFRISNIVRWTGNFTPPTAPYVIE